MSKLPATWEVRFLHLNALASWYGTPELSEFEGPAAKRRLEELLRSGSFASCPMVEMSTIASGPMYS